MKFRIGKFSRHPEVYDVLKRIERYLDGQLRIKFYSLEKNVFTDEIRTATSIDVKITFEEDKRKRIRGKDRRY